MKNLLLISVLVLITSVSYSQTIHHNLTVDINIESSTIDVVDTMKIPVDLFRDSKEAIFFLNNNLVLKSLDEQFEITKLDTEDFDADKAVTRIKYGIKFRKTDDKYLMVPIQYKGIIKHEIVEGAAEYARGFSETSGIIFEKGVYLAGSSYWVPYFDITEMASFNLRTRIDKDWNVVSQGERIRNELAGDKMLIEYVSSEPMDEVYLIAAKWTEYSEEHEGVLVQAFLRTPDEELAMRYIRVTADYIRLYQDLIGDYPYSKFALVENFWETGYGMPSFTLLGEKVIRFPWILHSSYPHELLHNYWGNSVFVDYETGNWCEGITVYMADHLIKEKQGIAADYRRTSLQKYTDYVNEENDFPVSGFISRNNSAEEAVGYGKSMMFNEMLRHRLGDDNFVESYAKFYNDNKFRKASFDDIRNSFEEISGEDLQSFFEQWIVRKGAPTIELSDVSVKKKGGKYIERFKLSQTQEEDVFDLLIPVALYLEGERDVKLENIVFNTREEYFTIVSDNRPVRIEIDPQFNVFRRLDRKEVPSSLSQVMGSKDGIIILPKESAHLAEYEGLARMWVQMQQAQGKILKLVYDSDIESLPTDKTAWVLGFENKFSEKVQISKDYLEYFSDEVAAKISTAKESGSLINTIANPYNSEFTFGFLATNNPLSLQSLSRKLMHYGKYGYLAFEGNDAINTLTGTFPIIDSPLIYRFEYEGDAAKTEAIIKPRKALAY